jgi:hypothetical protein
VADLHASDPVAAANEQIQALIQAHGGRIPDTAQPEYQRLVRVYLQAVNGGDEDEPLAA